MSETDHDTFELKEVGSVIWTDDDGTTYRREWKDGEIVDTVIA